MFNQIRIVLVHPTHPGNIGAAARAMKTMGLSQLYLVDPLHFPHTEAIARASGASDILEQATVCSTLTQALADCQWVFATSARDRSLSTTCLSVRDAGKQIAVASCHDQVAIVFGEERIGLTNQQIDLCQYHIKISANPDYSSLNLAAAVQLVCYEIRVAVLEGAVVVPPVQEAYASIEQLELFFKHLETLLYAVKFINPLQPRKLMTRLRRLYLRAKPTVREINILRGILTATQKSLESSEEEIKP